MRSLIAKCPYIEYEDLFSIDVLTILALLEAGKQFKTKIEEYCWYT